MALAWQPLPKWLVAETGLPEGAAVDALGLAAWESGLQAMSRRIELYVCRLLESRLSDLHDLAALDRPWPVELDPHLVPWSQIGRAHV